MISLENKKVIKRQNTPKTNRKAIKTWKYCTVLVLVCISTMWNVECSNGIQQNFIAAVSDGHLQVVKDLLPEIGDINDVKEDTGDTALIVACKRKHFEIVKLLLDNKADIDGVDSEGNAALVSSLFHSSPEMMKLLLVNGASINGDLFREMTCKFQGFQQIKNDLSKYKSIK